MNRATEPAPPSERTPTHASPSAIIERGCVSSPHHGAGSPGESQGTSEEATVPSDPTRTRGREAPEARASSASVATSERRRDAMIWWLRR